MKLLMSRLRLFFAWSPGSSRWPAEQAARIQQKALKVSLKMRPPATPDDIEAFERSAGVALPSDYRAFLLTVGNGGMEPCRLCPLEDWAVSYYADIAENPKWMSEPCLVTPDSQAHGELWLEKMDVLDGEDDEWNPLFGSMAIGEIGCGLFFSLVLTGPFRGRVFSWGDHPLDPPRFCPEPDFGSWMESYLDDMLRGRPVHFLDGRINSPSFCA